MVLCRLAAGASLFCLTCMPVSAGAAQTAGGADKVPVASVTEAVVAASQPPRTVMPQMGDLFKPLAGDFKRMAAGRNLALISVGAASALTSHSWDRRVASTTWGVGSVEETLEPGRFIGDFMMQTGSAFAVYAIGHLTNKPRVATIGAELFRAQLVAQGTAQVLKMSTRRIRPDGTSSSFPSGHTAAAFATATVLQSELGWKVGVPAYAVAALVGASRIQADRHYISDVVAGATVGLLAGRSVTFGRGSMRFNMKPTVIPGGIGFSIGRAN